ncbi:MAG: ABC transporter ATP-binding protein [Rhodobacteraceae bacterium]|nr:ABC transporter ATP-binding protein [Paracoccaceae bacterium]
MNQEAKPIIRIESILKNYGVIEALKSISFNIYQGEFLTLLGPSGCGKTTLLRVIAGFEIPNSGLVEIDGNNMEGIPANQRPTNMVFQSYAVFPHMTVGENVAYGLKARKVDKQTIFEEVNKALAMVGMEGFNDRPSTALSGGQRQRVALARALILKPKVLLLDEPLSALDKRLREQMQSELRQLQRSVGITFILVTHDQEEALTMSDRIAVMFDGKIAQLASPQELYKRPTNIQVANFVGTMNFLDLDLVAQEGNDLIVEIEGLGKTTLSMDQAPLGYQSNSMAGIRPEMFTIITNKSQSKTKVVNGRIVETQYFGDMTYFDANLEGTDKVVTISMRNSDISFEINIGSDVEIGWNPNSILVLS